jgi:hypothetical protein
MGVTRVKQMAAPSRSVAACEPGRRRRFFPEQRARSSGSPSHARRCSRSVSSTMASSGRKSRVARRVAWPRRHTSGGSGGTPSERSSPPPLRRSTVQLPAGGGNGHLPTGGAAKGVFTSRPVPVPCHIRAPPRSRPRFRPRHGSMPMPVATGPAPCVRSLSGWYSVIPAAGRPNFHSACRSSAFDHEEVDHGWPPECAALRG